MADGAERQETVCLPGICPEVLHPGQTGCKLMELSQDLNDLNKMLKGTPEEPEKGFIYQGMMCFKEVREMGKRRWTRAQKIALAAVIVPTLGGMIWWGCTTAYTFIQDVDQAIQELHQMHQTHYHQHPIPPKTGQMYTAHVNPLQQDAGIPIAVERSF